MKNSKLGKFQVWYENSDEFYELKREIFGENCYYLELETETPRIIDAGAHIGLATLYFKTIFPKAKITAYEPVHANFILLEKNVKENQLEKVEINELVVAPKPGRLKINEPVGSEAWKSGAGIIPKGWRGVQITSETEVRAKGILEVIQEEIDLFKMDTEGMEYELIRAAKPLLRNVKNWIIETHPRSGNRTEEIVKTLHSFGYSVDQFEDKSSLGGGLSQILAVLK